MWKRNLLILWIGNFFMMAGMNLIIPFLPLYVENLGVKDLHQVDIWSGFIFAGTPLLSGILAPFWGRFSDRYGRKVMLIRSGIGMSIVMILLGFARNPTELLLLRLLMGTVAGFIPSSYALLASETPAEYAGRALGTLQTGSVAGTMIGPLIGGVLSETVGVRNVFYLTGLFLLIAAVVVILGVQESKKFEKLSFKTLFQTNQNAARHDIAFMKELNIYPLFLTSFLIFFAMQSIEPIITVYVQSMHVQHHLETISGLVFAASGIGNILASPFLGRLGDKVGNVKVLYTSLLMMAVFSLPQAFISNVWGVIALRFLSGIFVGGLVPSVNALLKKNSPSEIQGTIYGFNQMANGMGSVAGPVFGGFVASRFGIPTIFYCTCVFYLFNYFWARKNQNRQIVFSTSSNRTQRIG
ncbi:MAG: arabinose efflux permease family protein [Bacilli bacterium]|nr:arabinose efflux permease family protein [Bacilli bacterium]